MIGKAFVPHVMRGGYSFFEKDHVQSRTSARLQLMERALVQLIRACARLFIGSDKFVFYLCAANGDVIF
jgi:hypothetical protein